MDKIKLAVISLGLLFLLWVASWFGLFGLIGSSNTKLQEVSAPTSIEVSQATITLDFGDGKVINDKLETDESTTAYSALIKLAENNNLELKTKQYDFGVFVESINGLKSGADMAWIYFVNGESGQVAADQMEVNPGDKVEWKYIKPSGE